MIPRHLSRRSPVFPSALIREVDHGSALVEFVIDREGRVQAPRVHTASHEAFGYAAVQAVATWRFQPPLKDGRKVEVRVRQEIRFKLN